MPTVAQPTTRLTRLELGGFKTIKYTDLRLGSRNVLIGANGAGKSNLVSFFRLLGWMLDSPGNLQFFVSRFGGANGLLHDGAAVTRQIHAHLELESPDGVTEYTFRLHHAAPDTLIFAGESFRFSANNVPRDGEWVGLGSGQKEARLIVQAEAGEPTARFIRRSLLQCVVYQFHNTSETARIRQRWDAEDNRFLKEDGANLAPFLRRLSETAPSAYRRIVETVRQAVPFFADFVLEPVGGTVLLQWRERGTDVLFGSHQASDGMLRYMALTALLLQPLDEVPAIVVLDEPELGLHPYAINIVAGLINSLSRHRQIILATQSMTLLDHFDPQDVVVVERVGRDSFFFRLSPDELREWLEEYSLAELWEKNVFGGRPAR